MPIVKWGETIQDELSRSWSTGIEHDPAGDVTFPVFIDYVYQQGRYDEHGMARYGHAADAPFINTPRDAREHYSKHFSSESSTDRQVDSRVHEFSGRWLAAGDVCREPVPLEQLAVSPLKIRGCASPQGARPLEMGVYGLL